MVWRSSPFFDQQFAMLCELGDSSLESSFAEDIRQGQDDQALLIFADWLEERDDARAQYIRDMCELSGLHWPASALLDRVTKFENSHVPQLLFGYRALPQCTIVMVFNPAVRFDEQGPIYSELNRAFSRRPDVRVLLDLEHLEAVGSAFLGVLIRGIRDAHNDGQEAPIVIATGQVREIFRIIRLNQLFPVCGAINEALELMDRS